MHKKRKVTSKEKNKLPETTNEEKIIKAAIMEITNFSIFMKKTSFSG
jgi:hypothetical protein